MKCEFRYTEDDYIEAQELYARYGRLTRWALPGLALAGLALVIFHGTHFFNDAEAEYTRLLYLLLGLFLMVYPLLSTRALRVRLGTPANLKEAFTLEVGDQGVVLKGQDLEAELHWEGLAGWREGSRTLLLFSRPGMFYIIPKRALSEAELRRIRELLDRHVSFPGRQ